MRVSITTRNYRSTRDVVKQPCSDIFGTRCGPHLEKQQVVCHHRRQPLQKGHARDKAEALNRKCEMSLSYQKRSRVNITLNNFICSTLERRKALLFPSM